MFKTNRINKNDVSWDPTSSNVYGEFQVLPLNGSMVYPVIHSVMTIRGRRRRKREEITEMEVIKARYLWPRYFPIGFLR